MLTRLFFLIGLCFILIENSNAQNTAPSKKELMEYLRVKLLAYSDEGTNYMYKDIFLDVNNCSMTFSFKSGEKQIVFFSNLDASTMKHDTYGFNDGGRLSINAVSEKSARIWYNADGAVEPLANISRFFYNKGTLLKEDNPDKARIEKAIKALIIACGGKDTKELF